ncbi:MAG TPA: hypothetical protein VGK19_08745 [Capsulimonadaceae bacterium]|jgi:hypothetical protein
MSANDTTILFRPVGQQELDLIAASGYSSFPPRLAFQPIFYPVLNEEYATQIASRWNVKDANSGFVGYVTKFNVRNSFLDKYEVHSVGSSIHLEYWIPAADVDEFNANIVGQIEVISEFRPTAK